MHLKSRALSDASVMLKDGDLTDEQYQNILLAHNQFNEAMQPPEPEIEIDDESPSLTGTSSTVSNASSNSSPGRKKSLSLFSLLPNSLLPTSLQTMSLHATPPPAPTRTSLAIAEATKARTRLLRKKNKLDQARATAITTDTQTWSQTVLPTWSPTAITSPLVRDLCLRGIPPKVRGPAWSHLIGNALCITPDLWTIHHSRGNRLMESVVAGSSKVGEEVAGSEWRGRDIDVDIPRTFPYLTFFHDGGEWENRLRSLLSTYCSYRPDVGYIQGMSFLAAMLLLQLDGCDAFVAFSNLLNNTRYYSKGYRPEMEESHLKAYNTCFSNNLPLLYEHFEKHGVQVELYLIDWRLSLFCRILKLDVAVRVWDCFLREGEVYFIKVALGILKTLAPLLATKSDLSDVVKLLRTGEGIEVAALLENVGKIHVTKSVESGISGQPRQKSGGCKQM